MANYTLNKTVYDRGAYINAVDTTFTQMTPPPPPIEDTITVEEFFGYYNKIFYDIPVQGDINSHAYLVKKSGDYIGGNAVNNDIQILLDEITSLRQQLLNSQQQLLMLQTSSSMAQVSSSIANM
jgi:hypothetical protein